MQIQQQSALKDHLKSLMLEGKDTATNKSSYITLLKTQTRVSYTMELCSD